MPVRSVHSSVLTWPDNAEVVAALRRWADDLVRRRGDILRVGYFGSYARGESGVGSDLDILLLVEHCDTPFNRRAAEWDTTPLPVPVDLLVYTPRELGSLQSSRMRTVLAGEVKWVYERDANTSDTPNANHQRG
ncbi:MAG: nucleotidyltransferase domain-containing protein [Chitinivibrionales bacterium]|nr:nucleotidyltransferase domain-containing protein [Chitinivibrionales bacterium]